MATVDPEDPFTQPERQHVGVSSPNSFLQGWSGTHSCRLRGYQMYLAVDTATGQAFTFVLTRGRSPPVPAT